MTLRWGEVSRRRGGEEGVDGGGERGRRTSGIVWLISGGGWVGLIYRSMYRLVGV